MHKLDKKGQAGLTTLIIAGGGVLMVAVVVLLLAALGVIPIAGVAFQAVPIDPATGQPAAGLGATTNPSIQAQVTEPKTRQPVQATITLYKVASDGSLNFAQQGTTTNGALAFSNLAANQNYSMELEPTGSTWWYPMKVDTFNGISLRTANAGPIDVPVAVTSMNNTAASISVFNHDNRTANTTSARQALSATDSKSFNLTIQPGASTNDNNFIGHARLGNLITVDVNRSIIQKFTGSDELGAMDCSRPAPTAHRNIDINRTQSLSCITNIKKLEPTRTYDIVLNFTTTTVDPTHNDIDCNGSMWGTFYDSCRVLNTQTGQYIDNWFNPVTLEDICITTGTYFAMEYS